ncbi:methyl-accepting chemotaxis protein [Chitinibacter tainanensis]|uniref:methyl-accepting chemotaxis protein n=1 Tax=Chitinibacter tainanensis TaxID=230667 RepID=UPI00040F1357|nr:methyl-accepting chemotaxis protein [Chitinibacter tainanensis]
MRLLYRLLLPPLVTLVMLLAFAGLMLLAGKYVRTGMDEISNTRFANLAAVNSLGLGLQQAQVQTYRTLTWTGTLGAEYFARESKGLVAGLGDALAKFKQWQEQAQLSTAEKEQAAAILKTATQYQKSVSEVLDMASDDINMGVTMMQSTDKLFADLSAQVHELKALETTLSHTARDEVDQQLRRIQWLMMIGTLVAAALAALLSIAVLRRISSQIYSASRIANAVAQGDLRQEIKPQGEDELGQLLKALAQMQQQLREMVVQIHTHTEHLEKSASELDHASGTITQAVRQQNESIGTAAVDLEEMAGNLHQAGEHADAAQQVAQRTAEIADTGQQLVNAAADEIQKIAALVQSSSAGMQHLQASSDAISNFANVIAEIAAQTNLLALNAAIEAARAGEAGRGFAVVADEVRKLAENTSTATSEIKKMLEQIQLQSGEAGQQMQSASTQVSTGVEHICALKEPLSELNQCSHSALAALVELVGIVQDQRQHGDHLVQMTEQIAQASNANVHSSDEAHRGAKSIHQTAGQLQRLIGHFRV